MGEFSKACKAHVEGDDVVFVLETGGKAREFEVSGDALRRFFGARDGSGAELMRAFEQGGDAIRATALGAGTPAQGRTALGSGDFDTPS